jgi:hypothetical protein
MSDDDAVEMEELKDSSPHAGEPVQVSSVSNQL